MLLRRRRRRIYLVGRLVLGLLVLLHHGIRKLSLCWGNRIAAAISEIYSFERGRGGEGKGG